MLGLARPEDLKKSCDVSNPNPVKSAFEWIEDNVCTVDVLINCARIFRFITVLNIEESLNCSLEDTMNDGCELYERTLLFKRIVSQ